MQAIGTGIYLAPSIIDHSCSPNAVVTFDGFKLRLQLIQELPTLDWKLIRISYIDLMNCNNDRKKELKERYYFDCDCPRCQSDTIDQYHYAAKCPSCQSPITVRVSQQNYLFTYSAFCFLNGAYFILYQKGEQLPPCTCGHVLSSLHTKQFWDATDYSEQQLVLMQDTNCKTIML